MTPPTPAPSTPTPSAQPVGARAEAPLRRPALAVTVLAGTVVLTGVIELLLQLLQSQL